MMRSDFAAIAKWIKPRSQVLDVGCGYHPYKVRIMYYDNQSGYIKMSRREKLSAIPLLPLTIAIDIIQLPLKALDITYQP